MATLNASKTTAIHTMTEPTISPEGFLLLDRSLSVISFNTAAAQILTYPQGAEMQGQLGEHLTGKIRSTLISQWSTKGMDVANTFRSGKRLYACRAFRLNAAARATSQPLLAILFERGAERTFSLNEVSERFQLTKREQAVIQYLLQGMTSKEIASRLGITANTVKAFLRLIMAKMTVSTRSGIVGKLLMTSMNQ